MNLKVSVIIPAYNSAQHLRRCLDSIFRSDMIDAVEVILVNDGSTDETLTIARDYLKHQQYKIIDKEYEGVAVARYTGFFESTGEYISFIDSDDYIAPNMLSKLYERAIQSKTKMVVCSACKVEKVQTYLAYQYPENITENTEKAIGRVIAQKINGQLWNKLFHRSVLKEENFKKTLGIACCQDMLMLFYTMLEVNKVSYVAEPLYYYMVNPNSTVQNPSFKAINDFYFVKTTLYQELMLSGIHSWDEYAQLFYARGLPWALRQLNKMNNSSEVKKLKLDITKQIKKLDIAELRKFAYNRLTVDFLLVRLGLFRLAYLLIDSKLLHKVWRLFTGR